MLELFILNLSPVDGGSSIIINMLIGAGLPGVAETLVTGVLLGIRHAFEPDHIVAISTLTDKNNDRPFKVGIRWALGHSIPIIIISFTFLGFGVTIPTGVVSMVEFVAGLVFLYLGLRTLNRIVTEFEFVSHTHEDKEQHYHLNLGKVIPGLVHSHTTDNETYSIGFIHGLIGSGTFVIVLAVTEPTLSSSITLLTAFTAVLVGMMGILSALWGKIIASSIGEYFQGCAGMTSILLGVLLIL